MQYNFNINYASDYQLTPIEYCNSKNKTEILELLNNFIQANKKYSDTYEALLNEIERLKNKIENIKQYVKTINKTVKTINKTVKTINKTIC